jgi:8-oxo-dGTP diphosphatase
MTGQQKVVVIAVIRNPEGKYLIAKRNDQDIPDSHNKWELVGGKLEYGEDPKDALLREVKEEAGLLITDITLAPKIFTQVWKRKNGEEFQVVLIPYFCTTQETALLPRPTDPKVAELKFVSIDQLKEFEFLPIDEEMIQLAHQKFN